jgi:stage V sporulation protein R
MAVRMAKPLPAEYRRWQLEIEGHARAYGLDFFDTVFELVDWEELNEIAALGGFPSRYPHWRFGMEYEQLQRSYRYGLAKIYELVINNDPCYAYLLDSNQPVDQKLVMAHVYGHCDFFKNNQWFAHTNRRMMDEMADHGGRIRKIMDRVGESEVEDFIDGCLSVEDLIDIHSPFVKRRVGIPEVRPGEEPEHHHHEPHRFDTKDYLEAFVNPRGALKAEVAEHDRQERQRTARFPTEPEKDVLLFLLEHGRLKPWQREVLSIIREEAYYFAPQGQTKIMNEGWASFWHSRIMTERVASDAEIVDFADHHSGTVHMPPGSFNPYKIGLELFRDIEERWDSGRFGREWEDCTDLERRRTWNVPTGLGRKKVYEVRRIHNDVTFIDEFLTEEFCRDRNLFSFSWNRGSRRYEIESREFDTIKERLLFQLTNHGRPFIYVYDANHQNRGELHLLHRFMGVELRGDYARDVLVNLHRLWGRPVHVETMAEDRPVLLGYDGKEHLTRILEHPTEEKRP